MEKSLSEKDFSLGFLKGKIRDSHLPPKDFKEEFQEFQQSHQAGIPSPFFGRFSASSTRESAQERQTRLLVSGFLQEQQERSHVNKYERERLRDLIIAARKLLHPKDEKPEENKTTVSNIRSDVNYVIAGLDQINRELPLYNPDKLELPSGVEVVEIETPELGKMAIKVTRIKGIKEESEETGKTIPTVVSTGWSADFKSTIAMQMSLALEGVDTFGIAMPEHYTSEVSPDWPKRLKKAGNYSLHAKALIEICKKLGIEEMDLTGYSAGGAVSIAVAHELSEHPKSGIQVRHLDAFNPTGFVQTTWPALAANFIKAGVQAMTIPEVGRRSMMVQRFNKSDWTSRGMLTMAKDILPKRVFTPEYLADIRTAGRCNIFASDTDPVSKELALRQEVNKAREYPKTQINIIGIKNGNHAMLVQGAAGFARSFAENTPITDGTDIKNIPAAQADLIARRYNITF